MVDQIEALLPGDYDYTTKSGTTAYDRYQQLAGEVKVGGRSLRQSLERAISSPMLETSMEGAKGVLLSVSGPSSMTLHEATEAARVVERLSRLEGIDLGYNETFNLAGSLFSFFFTEREVVDYATAQTTDRSINFRDNGAPGSDARFNSTGLTLSVTQPLYRSAAGRWQHYRRHLEPILPKLQPWIEKLGYEFR